MAKSCDMVILIDHQDAIVNQIEVQSYIKKISTEICLWEYCGIHGKLLT